MNRPRRVPEDQTLTSFLDTLSNGVAAAIVLLMVFGTAALQGGAPPFVAAPLHLHLQVAIPATDHLVFARVANASPASVSIIGLKVPNDPTGFEAVDGLLRITSPAAAAGDNDVAILQIATSPGACVDLRFGLRRTPSKDSVGALSPLSITVAWTGNEDGTKHDALAALGLPLGLSVDDTGTVQRCPVVD